MGIKCFFVEPTERTRRQLRRFTYDSNIDCHKGYGHDASSDLDVVPRAIEAGADHYPSLPDPKIPHDDPRWPTKCSSCDYPFSESDRWQVFDEQIYIDRATGAEYFLREAHRHPGMMWDAFWACEDDKGPDGRSLVVICPDGHEWMIDGRCSNCAAPKDRGPYGKAHRCWTRAGVPPLIQVGKGFGKSCSAGGGSIKTPGYHGFLGTRGAAPGYFT